MTPDHSKLIRIDSLWFSISPPLWVSQAFSDPSIQIEVHLFSSQLIIPVLRSIFIHCTCSGGVALFWADDTLSNHLFRVREVILVVPNFPFPTFFRWSWFFVAPVQVLVHQPPLYCPSRRGIHLLTSPTPLLWSFYLSNINFRSRVRDSKVPVWYQWDNFCLKWPRAVGWRFTFLLTVSIWC